MSGSQTGLRTDNPNHPAFLMIRRPTDFGETRVRAAEWLLASWAYLAAPNDLGVHHVDEARGSSYR